jgi:hypothetical protein
MTSLESNFIMPTIPQSIQTLFNDHQARLAAVSAAPGVVGLSLELDQMSATYLSKAVQILVRPKYAADSNTGTSPEDKISSLASSVSRLSKQVRPSAPNDAFHSAFTSGSIGGISFDFRTDDAELNNSTPKRARPNLRSSPEYLSIPRLR